MEPNVRKRLPKTTSRQFEQLLLFVEDNRVLIHGKTKPLEAKMQGDLSKKFAQQMSTEPGPLKTADQWKKVLFELVELSSAKVSIAPSIIHFGTVDAGLSTTLRVLHLRNDGGQQTPFFVDTPKGDVHDVIVEPTRGYLPPRSCTELKFRLVSLAEGELNDEVWIKCNAPVRVPVKATIITPKFEAIHLNSLERCTVIDFPLTYQGTSSCQNLLIRNVSSKSAMYFIVGSIDGTLLELSKCLELHKDFRNFKMYPHDGRFEPQETKLFQLSFTPLKGKAKEKKQSFYFCQMHVVKVDCKDLRDEDYPGGVFAKDDDPGMRHSHRSSRPSRISGEADVLDSSSGHPVLLAQPGNVELLLKTFDTASNDIKIFLHGIAEEPSVVITPNQLDLADVVLHAKEVRVLEIRNNSSKLPIILHYKRVSGIELKKDNIFLKQSERVQISITINPTHTGYISTKIVFNLLFYNYPKSDNDLYKVVGSIWIPVNFNVIANAHFGKAILNTGLRPNYLNEVGKNCKNIKFNSKLYNTKCITAGLKTPLDANCNDLVAFPNDRSTSIRPWRSATRTIFTRTPRYTPPLENEYEVTLTDRELKVELNEHYVNFMRSLHEKFKKYGVHTLDPEVEYELTMCNKILQTDRDCAACIVDRADHMSFPDDCCFALTPSEIYNITITPKIIETGAIPTNHIHCFKIQVENKNIFSIRVFIRPDKVNVNFPEGNRRTVEASTSTSLKILYTSADIGCYTLPLDFIINESVVLSVTILANVVSRTLTLTKTKLQFNDEVLHHYIDLENLLNIAIPFEWSLACANFQVIPLRGYVAPNSTMTCLVRHLPNVRGRRHYDLDFRSGEALYIQQIHVTSYVRPQPLTVLRKTEFKDLPLNMTICKKLYVQNNQNFPLSYRLIQCELSDKALDRKEETIPAYGVAAMTFNARIANCVSFKSTIKLDIVQCGILEIPVDGNVVYPDIVIVPKVISFRKIPCSTTDTQKFSITNCSVTSATVRFQMNDFPEFKITENNFNWDTAFDEEIFLEPDENKTLFVHFIPTEVQSTTFYLPIIINGILGPPIFGDVLTTKVDYYLRDNPPESTSNPTPSHMPSVKIYSHAIDPKLIFSNLTLNFYHSPQNPQLSTLKLKLSITNPQKVNEDFCICIDEIANLYVMEIEKLSDVVVCKKNPRIIMLPKEKISLIFTIVPLNFTERCIKLPILIRKEQKAEPTAHNYITLNSIFKKAVIEADHYTTFCRPIPLRHSAIYNNNLTLKYHGPNCKLSVKCCLQDASAELILDSFKQIKDSVSTITMTFKTLFSEMIVFRTNVKVSCTCGALLRVAYNGCADNCLLTTYAFSCIYLMDNDELDSRTQCLLARRTSITSAMSEMSTIDALSDLNLITDFNLTQFYPMYPFSPHGSDLKDSGLKTLKEILDDVVHASESWLYSQAFFGTQYPIIPTGINAIDFNRSRAVVKNAEMSVIPFVQVLINLIGVQIRTVLGLHSVPRTAMEQANYLYTLYDNIIKFLTTMGACLPYLRPEFLLEYQVFELYLKNNYFDREPSPLVAKMINFTEFSNVSRQAWCDLILQTYKVISLQRMQEQTCSKSCSFTVRQSPMMQYQRSLKDINRNDSRESENIHILGKGELMLINWLEFHFNSMKDNLWHGLDIPEMREVDFFGKGLMDGLVFAALTATYCPYLKSELRKMYTIPGTPEERLQNNIKVIKCWDMINYSFKVTPEELKRPKPIRLLMLVSYLYEVMPFMFPGETIEIKAGLSQKSSVQIKIQNDNTFSIAYKALFFANEMNCFTTDESIYVITPKTEAEIIIEYYAKYAKILTATLLLSGEVTGYHYAKSKTVALLGLPDLEYMTSTIKLTSNLYSCKEMTFTLKAPYPTTAYYEMQVSHDPISTSEELDKIPYTSSLIDQHYSRIVTLDKTVLCRNGVGKLRVVCNVCLKKDMTTSIYFKHPEFGDFAVSFITKVKNVKVEEKLVVKVPRLMNKYDKVYMEIPSRNNILWKTFKETLMKITSGSERVFWDKNIDSTSGMHLLHNMVLRTIERYSGICGPKTLNIIPEEDGEIEFPKDVTFADNCSMGSEKVAVTIGRQVQLPLTIKFHLESPDGDSNRYYLATFVYDD